MNCANHPERERIAFCQNCGKPLCQECARTIGTAVFCEPCLEARLAGTATPPQAASTGYTYTASGSTGSANYTTSATGGSYRYTDPASGYTVNGTIPPTGAPNPGLAALLGFIPGVGAMYNGQYAKGVVHLIIFAILVSLTDSHEIFGLFVAGWVFYQVFDAYQTAVARRDGLPLPNPFGFNDIGERLGFNKSWAAGSSTPYTAPPPPNIPPTGTAAPAAGNIPQQQAPWETPWANYVPPASDPYMSTPPAFDPNSAPNPAYRNRFPSGAIWLIGLGVLFLIGNANIFHALPMHILFPAFLIGLGVWIFYNRMTATGATLADDGSAFYRMRLLSALRGSVWIILVGVMFLLSNLHILSWGRSWPLFIIVAGVLILIERTTFASANAPAYYPPQSYQAPPAASSSTTSVVPPAQQEETPNQFNQEGR